MASFTGSGHSASQSESPHYSDGKYDDSDSDDFDEDAFFFNTSNNCTSASEASEGVSIDNLSRLTAQLMPSIGDILQQPAKPVWDQNHVRMPFADTRAPNGKSRWGKIKACLSDVRKKIPNPGILSELQELILEYNSSQRYRWDFGGFRYFSQKLAPEEQWSLLETLDDMGKLAAQLREICPQPIPLLRKKSLTSNDHHVVTQSFSLTRRQIACLLANAFFCTFPMRNQKPTATRNRTDMPILPTINFSSLFKLYKDADVPCEKLHCMLNYFRRVIDSTSCARDIVTFERRTLSRAVIWHRSSSEFTELHLSPNGRIEYDFSGMLLVDFANKLVGGGVLGRGCVQEEILFLGFPEMIVSRLFTEELDDHDCLVMTGCQRYNKYHGYSNTFKFDGNFNDDTKSDAEGRKLTQFVAVDAQKYYNSEMQFEIRAITRELNKAFCGFYREHDSSQGKLPAVATGHWGCGAFHGDRQLKALIQLMAAAEAGRDVCFCTFRDAEFTRQLQQIHSFFRECHLTVGDVFKIITEQYCRKVAMSSNPSQLPNGGLFQFILDTYERLPPPEQS